MTVMAPRRLITSIHDVSPRFESEVDQLRDLLGHRLGTRVAMLVVPNHWGTSPIVPGSSFATRLRDWSDGGIEILLHGFFHLDESPHRRFSDRARASLMTAGEGEFLGLSARAAASRIEQGRSMLEDVLGKPVAGFVAPAWLYGRGALDALATSGIPLAEDHWRVWLPETGRTLARGPVITWASRSRVRLLSSLIAASVLRNAPLDTLRIGVHPSDVRHGQLLRSIDETVAAATDKRRPASYSELLIA
jgi:predicted deacetylase